MHGNQLLLPSGVSEMTYYTFMENTDSFLTSSLSISYTQARTHTSLQSFLYTFMLGNKYNLSYAGTISQRNDRCQSLGWCLCCAAVGMISLLALLMVFTNLTVFTNLMVFMNLTSKNQYSSDSNNPNSQSIRTTMFSKKNVFREVQVHIPTLKL